MTLKEFDTWCRSFLQIDALADKDDSLNGVQVGRSASPMHKVAFAVDACAESIRRAAAAGAQALFVHHGMFWGAPLRIQGAAYGRMRLLVQSDMALYACHLPLDMHPEVGNNAVLADLLGLVKRQNFGIYHGIALGFSGDFPQPLTIEEIIRKVLPDGSTPRHIVATGRKEFRNAAVVSGGASFEALQAIERNLDIYITGEPSHSMSHIVREEGLDFIAAGHYATEVWGVKAVAEKLSREKGLDTVFIDVPTGL